MMCAESVWNIVRDKNLGHFISLCINIRSLANTKNFVNFLSLLNDLSICPTFLSIAETWLSINQKGSFLNLPNYRFYSMPRKTRQGFGVGTYIHKNQFHWPREDLNKVEEGIFELSFFELKIDTVNIICGSTYHRSSSK